jgi:hypothetical protein
VWKLQKFSRQAHVRKRYGAMSRWTQLTEHLWMENQ